MSGHQIGGFKTTPPPEQVSPYAAGFESGYPYASMNSIQPAYDVHQSHMSQHASSGPPSGIGHYAQYHQPPLLQPGPQSYSSAPSAYSQYHYGGGMSQSGGHPPSSSMGNPMLQQSLPLPGEFF
ncbi:MAG: hypothetical protein INR71_08500 [Terriglobus roseus]|nr:hypothetical protein [Terriglobus roseus]